MLFEGRDDTVLRSKLYDPNLGVQSGNKLEPSPFSSPPPPKTVCAVKTVRPKVAKLSRWVANSTYYPHTMIFIDLKVVL